MSNIFQKAPPPYQYVLNFPNLVDLNVAQITRTAPVTNALLQATLIPSLAFQQVGQLYTIKAFGSATAHGASAITLIVQLGGTTVMTGTISAAGVTAPWDVEILLIRINATTLIVVASMSFNYSTNTTPSTSNTQRCNTLLTPNFSQDMTVQFLCTDAGGAENIIQDYTLIVVH